jgi:diguanylate cyclase (GGDEF)-like protein
MLAAAVPGILVGLTLTARAIEHHDIAGHAAIVRAEATQLGRGLADGSLRRADLPSYLDTLVTLPNVDSATVVDEGGSVVAKAPGAGDADGIAAATVRSVIASGRGRTDIEQERGGIEHVQPIHAGRLALAVDYDLDGVRGAVTRMRLGLGLGALATILAMIAVFWLVGGRRIRRMHLDALARATTDPLTGLGNHRAFHDELRRAVAIAGRRGEPLSLLCLDLDGFKLANDRHGHRHGDELLRFVGGALSAGRAEDRGFRLGGDEFALLMPRADEAAALDLAARLRCTLATQDIRVSMGISEAAGGTNADELREEADTAQYEAKRAGGDRVTTFSDVDVEQVFTPAHAKALEALIEHRSLSVAFQPIWSLGGEVPLGYEALARPHDDFPLAGPAEAFGLAERLGLVSQLDILCIETAMAAVEELPPDALVFVNVTPTALVRRRDLPRLIGEQADLHGIPHGRIVVEITERGAVHTGSLVVAGDALRSLGFLLALDDVGSGNSGLELMREIPFDFVKIDRSIVANAADDPGARAVLHGIAAFASEAGAFVIAEGIEDERTLSCRTCTSTASAGDASTARRDSCWAGLRPPPYLSPPDRGGDGPPAGRLCGTLARDVLS